METITINLALGPLHMKRLAEEGVRILSGVLKGDKIAEFIVEEVLEAVHAALNVDKEGSSSSGQHYPGDGMNP